MKRIITILLILGVYGDVTACINIYRTALDGHVVYEEYVSGSINPEEFDEKSLNKELIELLTEYENTGDVKIYSDYGATLIYLRKYEEARDVYQEIEKKSPGLYATASNIGTLYELMGVLDSALLWIQRSIEINPNSHSNSEWIHIKILEYKISGDDKSSSIIGYNFGSNVPPEIPIGVNLEELEKVRRDIRYQLTERIPLVGTKDIVVGSLLFDYGNILAVIRNLEAAIEAYEQAKEFGFSSDLLELRLADFKQKIKKADRRQSFEENAVNVKEYQLRTIWDYGVQIITVLLLLLIGVMILRKKIGR